MTHPPSSNPAAARKRRYRKRRREGIRVVPVEVDALDVADLVMSGTLDRAKKDDKEEIGRAIQTRVRAPISEN